MAEATTASPTVAGAPSNDAPLSFHRSTSRVILTWSIVILLRVLIGFQPHSGQDNYHGLHSAYGGDFEAQRHWMELTLHLPLGEWYWYDLAYWGLDYPPLSAYQCWLCGYLSHYLVGPESVALVHSRGWEHPTHKAFMRGTVIVFDILLYGSAAWTIVRHICCMHYREKETAKNDKQRWIFFTTLFGFAMAQPAILLIDHGTKFF